MAKFDDLMGAIMYDEFLIMYQNLVKARFPEEIFGALKATSVKEQKTELKKHFHHILTKVHPDRYENDKKTKYMAEEATRLLTDFHEKAQDSISKKTYGSMTGQVSSQGNVEMTFNLNGYEYKIFSDGVEGDFCQILFGERTRSGDLENICLKIANDEEDNPLIVNESKILRAVQHKSLPILLDSFELEDGKRVNVLRKIEDSYDLYSLEEHFPDGLPQEHGVWVMDRLLSVLGYLHTSNVIHGGIEPGNIMVTPSNHNGLLIDFLLAVSEADQRTAKYVGVNDYSAPEIQSGARPHPAADMYSLGKSMVYLLGGQGDTLPSGTDSRIVTFLGGFLEQDPKKRKNDAWKAWHELKDLRTEVFGAPSQFLELNIGGAKK